MPVAITEAADLVFDRRTVARSDALDLSAIHRRPQEIVADDAMALHGRSRDAAIDLLVGYPVRHEGEGNGLVVSTLAIEA